MNNKKLLPLAVLFGLLLIYLYPNGKLPALGTVVHSVMPWSIKAEPAAKSLFSGESGDNVAASIQRLTHPTGENPKLRDVRVSYHDGALHTTITVRWTGGFLGGNYETTIQWRCSEERDLGIRILKDDAIVGIANENFRQLESYFESYVYSVLKRNLGESSSTSAPSPPTE